MTILLTKPTYSGYQKERGCQVKQASLPNWFFGHVDSGEGARMFHIRLVESSNSSDDG